MPATAAAETVAVERTYPEPPPDRCMLYSSSCLAGDLTLHCPDALQIWEGQQRLCALGCCQQGRRALQQL
jgi:hypothetical protein